MRSCIYAPSKAEEKARETRKARHELKKLIAEKGYRTCNDVLRELTITFTKKDAADTCDNHLNTLGLNKSLLIENYDEYTTYHFTLTAKDYDTLMGAGAFKRFQHTCDELIISTCILI